MYKNESFEHMFEAFVLLKGCFKNICRKKKNNLPILHLNYM